MALLSSRSFPFSTTAEKETRCCHVFRFSRTMCLVSCLNITSSLFEFQLFDSMERTLKALMNFLRRSVCSLFEILPFRSRLLILSLEIIFKQPSETLKCHKLTFNMYKKLCPPSESLLSVMKNGIWCFWTRLKIHSRLGITLRLVNLNYCCLFAPRSRLFIFIFLCSSDTSWLQKQMQIMVSEYEAVLVLEIWWEFIFALSFRYR